MGSPVALDKSLSAGPAPAALPQALTLSLAYREVLLLAGDRRGLRIIAGRAPIWVTQEGDPGDYVLEPGERFIVDRAGRVVAQGMRWTGR